MVCNIVSALLFAVCGNGQRAAKFTRATSRNGCRRVPAAEWEKFAHRCSNGPETVQGRSPSASSRPCLKMFLAPTTFSVGKFTAAGSGANSCWAKQRCSPREIDSPHSQRFRVAATTAIRSCTRHFSRFPPARKRFFLFFTLALV